MYDQQRTIGSIVNLVRPGPHSSVLMVAGSTGRGDGSGSVIFIST